MANWLKVYQPVVELTSGYLIHETAVINLDAANAFAIQVDGTITLFIDGKGYMVQEQFDLSGYQAILKYIQARTQNELP